MNKLMALIRTSNRQEPPREPPVWCEGGEATPANITCELWKERRKVSNIRREFPLQNARVVGIAGNESGTAEVISPLSLI